jgi:hypothetical protein
MGTRDLDAKLPVNLYLHPEDAKALGRAGPGRKSALVSLALRVLELAPDELKDRARLDLAKRDSA